MLMMPPALVTVIGSTTLVLEAQLHKSEPVIVVALDKFIRRDGCVHPGHTSRESETLLFKGHHSRMNARK